MSPYNEAFFRLYEDTFLILKSEFGGEVAIKIVREIFQKGLKRAYDLLTFRKGNSKDFARIVGARDGSVGLRVEFPKISDNLIVYRFLTDPFPNLRNEVLHKDLDATYMDFKVDYLLGMDWTYCTTKHLWDGDSFTEHLITRVTK
jgi:hypothetical protein